MATAKNFKVGSKHPVDIGDPKILGTITQERCWQCRKTSVLKYKTPGGGVSKSCMNFCGPESLEALKIVVCHIAEHGHGVRKIPDEQWDIVRAAVTKATGTENKETN